MKTVLRSFLAFLVSVAVLSFGSAVADESEFDTPQLMQLLSQIKKSEVRFVEIKRSVYLTVPIRVTGVLRYEAPDKLEKHARAPLDERFVADGNRLVMARSVEGREMKRHLNLADYPGLRPFVEGLRATLAGDLATLETHYVVTMTGNAANWQLRLFPRDETLRAKVSEIRIVGAGPSIGRVETHEANGDTSIMTIIKAGT